jgi:hypothetical protein
MAANGKPAQYLKFYHHLSRCIVFFGLPRCEVNRKEIEVKKENDLKEEVDNLRLDIE